MSQALVIANRLDMASNGHMAAGDEARRLRKKRRRTLKDVAQVIGVDLSTVAKWEKGTHPQTFELAKRWDEVIGAEGALLRKLYPIDGPPSTAEADNGRICLPWSDWERLVQGAVAGALRAFQQVNDGG